MTAEQAKAVAAYFAALMDNESKSTCRVLAAVPDDRRDYRPDEKSRSAWEIATHLATSDVWFLTSIANGRFAFDPDAQQQAMAQFTSVRDVVAYYEREYAAAVARIRALGPDQLLATVDFFGIMQRPAVDFLGLANNHGIHHRGQLASYLRAMGSKVPAIYGGSADEPVSAAG